MVLKNTSLCLFLAILSLTATVRTDYWPSPIALACGCTLATVFLTRAYSQKVYTQACNSYAHVHHIVAEPNHAAQHNALQQEVMQYHQRVCQSYTFGTHPYRYYPFLYYKKQLDSTISELSFGTFITFGLEYSAQMRDLMSDLTTLRYILEEDPRYQEEYVYHLYVQRRIEHDKRWNC